MTENLPEYIIPLQEGWRLDVWVQPGAKEEGAAGVYQGRLKLKLKARAVDNKANKALVGLVASLIGIKKKGVAITSGRSSRKKTLLITSDKEPAWEELIPGH